jgi:hypothetical protein
MGRDNDHKRNKMAAKVTYSRTAQLSKATNPAYRIGFWSAAASTALGILYFIIILVSVATGQFTFPPPDWLQLSAGIISLVVCPLLVVMFTSLYAITSPEKKVYSLAALAFTVLFAMSVSTNRFSQLGVVRQGLAAGNTEGIGWFLAYGDFSVMLGMEFMGWAWFLSLGMLCAAPLFSKGRLQKWLRGLMLLYGSLGVVAAVGFLMPSPLSMLGFVAWGVVLFIVTWLLAIYFQQNTNI